MIRPALLLAALADPAVAAEGAALFEARCASCHGLVAAAPPGAGPALAGLEGRPLAGDAAYDYSPSLRAASGRWDRARLAAFLRDPEGAFPGSWMSDPGLRSAAEAEAIARFLLPGS